jgi:hypothetical protein
MFENSADHQNGTIGEFFLAVNVASHIKESSNELHLGR